MNLRIVIKGVELAATAAGVGYAALRTADGERLDRALFKAGNTDAGPGADRFFLGVTELVREDVVASLSALAKTPDDQDVVTRAADGYEFG